MSSAIGGLLGGVGGGRREGGTEAVEAQERIACLLRLGGEGFDAGDLRSQRVTLDAETVNLLCSLVAERLRDAQVVGKPARLALYDLQLTDEAEDRGGIRRSNELGVLVEGEGVREDGSRRARNLLPVAVTVCGPRAWRGCLGLALQVVDPVTHRLLPQDRTAPGRGQLLAHTPAHP